MYFCAELLDDECLSWVRFSDFFTFQDAALIGGAFLILSATAWGISMVAHVILTNSANRG